MTPMMLIAAMLAAGPQLKLAVLDVKTVAMAEGQSGFFTEHLVTQLSLAGAAPVSSTQLGAVVGLERQKQLLGCAESSCMAEIASAMGVDGLVMVEVAKVGKVFQINGRAINAANGQAVATYTRRADREEQVLDALTEAATTMARTAATALNRALTGTATNASSGSLRRLFWAPLAVGVVGLAVGAGLLLKSDGDHRTLSTAQAPLLTQTQAGQLATEGGNLQTGGLIALGLGAAACLTSLAFFIFGGPDSSVAPVVLVSDRGGLFGLVGVWP